MKLIAKLNPESTEQVDGYLGTVRIGAASRVGDEIRLIFCPTCCGRVAESSGREGVCSNPSCCADFGDDLRALRSRFEEGVDEL